MKRFIISICIIITNFAYACTGDCIACHPVLKKSIEESHHRILKSCIECHKNNTGNTGSCGKDCFDCHDKQKLIASSLPEHRAIKNCSKCHIDRLNIIEKIRFTGNLYLI